LRRAFSPLSRRSREAGELVPPRPLAIPTVSFLGSRDDLGGNPHVVAADARAGGITVSRSVLAHLLHDVLPYAASAAAGVLDGVVKRTDVSPGVGADAETKRCGMGARPGPRFERGAAVAGDMRNRPEPFGGEPVAVSDGKMEWRRGRGPRLLLDTRRRRVAMPLPAPSSGTRRVTEGGPGLPAHRAI